MHKNYIKSQTTLDFTQVVHIGENNNESQQILQSNYKRLNNNCKILFDALMRGERLTGKTIISKYNMFEYRRRIADLKAAGVQIKEKVLGNGTKEWFL